MPTAQVQQALRKANKTRERRAQMKRDFRFYVRSPIPVLQRPPAYAAGMPVDKFLMAIPKLGRERVRFILRDCVIPGHITLGELTPRQRKVLTNELKERMEWV